MCGIAGFTHRNRPADGTIIRRATASLSHRGPDEQGVFESPQVSLGAVRLKIIDLEGGGQPILSPDRDTVIVFNGEIYNHVELRRDLESRGHRFRSHCDTEVALHAFLEWDTDCFARFRGMFAVALWSESANRLVLARDRMGIKPLYLYRRGADLFFASELKALFEHPEVSRVLDPVALRHYLSLNYVPCPYTLVEGIRKLPPGQWLEWHKGETRTEAYWRLEFRPDESWTLDSAKEALDSHLRDAVREHMISDVPLGIWASGGLDSSTILHYAAEVSSTRLKTFSVSFQGRKFDESPYFRDVASRYGTEHHEFDLNPGVELRNAIEQFAYYSDEPSADAGALPVWFLSRMTREFVTVALSGDGGDELFGGYLTYLADSWARGLRMVPAAFRRAALKSMKWCWPVSDEKISFEYKLKRLFEGSLLSPDEAHFFWNGTCSQAESRQLCVLDAHPSLHSLMDNLPSGLDEIGFLNRYLMSDQHYYLADDILYKVDRMSMAHSLEVRPPLLDHRIVSFAASLPQNLKVRGLSQKYVLKQLMRDKLPASIVNRKKVGFDMPAHDWFRGILRSFLMDTLTDDAVRETGIFNPSAVKSLIRDHMERRANVGYHLWGLLTLFLWMKRWGIQTCQPTGEMHETEVPVFATN